MPVWVRRIPRYDVVRKCPAGPVALLLRGLCSRLLRMLAGVFRVRHADDAEQDDEQHDAAEDQAAEAGRLVAGLGSAAHDTRTCVMTSFFLICFITSSPSVILPNTV